MSSASALEVTDEDLLSFDELAPGTSLLDGRYEITGFLNAGGFGITYMARDASGGTLVLKECFPSALCRRSGNQVLARSRGYQADFQFAIGSFIDEARSLTKVSHPNVVGLRESFEENGTAYMAMDYVDGGDLIAILEDDDRRLTPKDIQQVLDDLLHAVGFVHRAGILHRDIAPDNILIRTDGTPVLIDFGAARDLATRHSRLLSAMHAVKDGYSPQEFYIVGSMQHPSSDLYALGATIYHCIYGEAPPNSQIRLAAIAMGAADPYNCLAGRDIGYPQAFLAAIDRALSVFPEDRPKSAEDWLQSIETAEVHTAEIIQLPVIVTPVRPIVASAPPEPPVKEPDAYLTQFLRGFTTACLLTTLISYGVAFYMHGQVRTVIQIAEPAQISLETLVVAAQDVIGAVPPAAAMAGTAANAPAKPVAVTPKVISVRPSRAPGPH